MSGAQVPASRPTRGQRVLLGVTGGVAAYKAVELCRLMQESGRSVGVIQTKSAQEFVGAATFVALTGEPVLTGQADAHGTFPHLDAGRDADVLVIAPATAATIARMAAGIADDVLVATYIAFDGPVVVAPAMNVRMWEHPTTQRAVAQLRSDGVTIVDPEAGELACGDVGMGRLASVTRIAHAVEQELSRRHDLAGHTIVVTAGGTREPIDAVRWITNRSSGRMGVAIAREAQERGAQVRLLVTESVDPDLYAGMPATVVDTAAQLSDALDTSLDGATALVMAAAVSDFSPECADGKLPRGSTATLTLHPVPDLLRGIARRYADDASLSGVRPILVGFAAEAGPEGLDRARAKRVDKGIDYIVYNDISQPGIGFESHDNAVTVIGDSQPDVVIGKMPKSGVAARILDLVSTALAEQQRPSVLQ